MAGNINKLKLILYLYNVEKSIIAGDYFVMLKIILNCGSDNYEGLNPANSWLKFWNLIGLTDWLV